MDAYFVPQFVDLPNGEKLAYQSLNPHHHSEIGLVFLGGFHSNMMSLKAEFCANYAAANKISFIRFDYYGHGLSTGNPGWGTVSRWLDDTLHVLDELTHPQQTQVLIGSSMGGWLALLAAKQREHRIKEVICLAPAVDFTEQLIWKRMPEEIKKELEVHNGLYFYKNDYPGKPHYPINMQLIEDGRKHLLLHESLHINVPIQILHGLNDKSIPWEISMKLCDVIHGNNVAITLIKNGEHSLEKSENLDLIRASLNKALI